MSLQSPPDGATRKLPLGATIKLAFASYFECFDDVLRTTWLWLVIVGPLGYLAAWQQAVWMNSVMASIKQGTPPSTVMASRPFDTMLLGHLETVASFIAGISIAVAWHRRVILDEQPGMSGGNLLSASLWRYVGSGLVIFLVAGAPLLLLLVLTSLFGGSILSVRPSPASGGFVAVTIGFLLLYIVGIAVVMRLILVFPARAADDIGLTLQAAWHRSHGNTWRMFWGLVVCGVAPALVFLLVLMALGGNPAADLLTGGLQPHRSAAFATITLIFYILLLPISIGFLSHAYLYLARRPA